MTQKDSLAAMMDSRGQIVRLVSSEVHLPEARRWCGVKNSSEADEFTLARKVAKYVRGSPYRKPTQVDGKKIARRAGEPLLRNSAKWPRNFGRRGASKEAAVKRPKRLFIKNTGFCENASWSIGADACPVLEGQGEVLEQSKHGT